MADGHSTIAGPKIGERGHAVCGQSRIVGTVDGYGAGFLTIHPDGQSDDYSGLVLRDAAGWTWHPDLQPCRSGHTDCTVDCGWCKGTGIDGGKPALPSSAPNSKEKRP